MMMVVVMKMIIFFSTLNPDSEFPRINALRCEELTRSLQHTVFNAAHCWEWQFSYPQFLCISISTARACHHTNLQGEEAHSYCRIHFCSPQGKTSRHLASQQFYSKEKRIKTHPTMDSIELRKRHKLRTPQLKNYMSKRCSSLISIANELGKILIEE